MERIFSARPFKTRNADEYDINTVLNLFVNPLVGISTPFDYENSIIKGRMGSGKTMYLRANHAYYLSALLPAISESPSEIILPIMIKLNDFQHISEPSDIYKSIIIKVVEEMTSIYSILEDTKNLANIHANLKQIPDAVMRRNKNYEMMHRIAAMSSEEYLQKVSTNKGAKGNIKLNILETSAEWNRTHHDEFKKKTNPGIKDVEDCYKFLLNDSDGKILLLIDEAGALDKNFFKGEQDKPCLFEVLMNQFRTSSFIRTKVAVYPNSFSDMLTETRYGDVVMLEDKVSDEVGYSRLRKKAITIVNNYINPHSDSSLPFRASDIFETSPHPRIYGDALEMILYASNGNMRRLIQLFDISMDTSFSENGYAQRVEKKHVIDALKRHATNNENTLSSQEKDFLEDVISVCKSRAAYKFSFPNVPLYKYTSKSKEFNLINIDQPGSGRNATVYSFDFSYCVLKDIPTHRMHDDERIYKERSGDLGRWSTRKAIISQEMIKQASFPGKVEGVIDFINEDGKHGFILGDDGKQAFFMDRDIIESDRNKSFHVGKRLRYYPHESAPNEIIAVIIEVL